MKKFIFLSFIFASFTALFSSVATKESPTLPSVEKQLPPAPYPSWEEVVDFASQNLPLEGELMQKNDGYVYLKVDDRYIDTLFPLLGLTEEGFRKPPYFRRPNSVGAHISVFYSNENIHPKELGQIFHFTLKKIIIVKVANRIDYVILQVEAPELEQLREKYGLPAKIHGNEFHITLGKKVRPFKT